MENVLEIKDQLQKAVDTLCKAKKFEEEGMLIAQRIGLQGEKRRLRYESAKTHNLINYLRCDSYDVYKIQLSGNSQAVTVPDISSLKGFFETFLQKMEDQYEALHTYANKLVVLNARHYAEPLYKKCECLLDDIKYYKRTIMEGNNTSWSVEFMYLHQTTGENVHDCFESKEKEVGYCF